MGYKGLQEVTSCLWGVEGVRGYKRFKGLTTGYRGSQRVTGGYKWLKG